MKSLVIYDSNFGNTQKIAEEIAHKLTAICIPVTQFQPLMLNEVELIIVGSPINAWRPTERIRTFLNELVPGSLKGIKAAAFDTRIKIFMSGNAAKKIASVLKRKGATIIAAPEGYYVKDNPGPLLDGELERAGKWAEEILTKFNS